MFLSIIKFFGGFVLVRLSGYAPERFFNLCCNHDIVIWNLQYKEGCYEFCISNRAFFSLKPILRKTKTKVKVLERHGLPFFLFRYRKRKLFFLGIVLCGLLLFLLSQYIWNIEICGNMNITDETILSYLETQKLSFGTAKSKIDASALEEELRDSFPEIIWTSVQIRGTKMTIDLKENLVIQPVEKPNDGKAYDITADKDAIIDSIITRQGTPLVQEASVVKKGDILVCGRLDILGDGGEITNYEYCVSDADIIGITDIPYEDSFALSYEEKNWTGNEKNRYSVDIFLYHFSIPAPKLPYEHYDTFSTVRQIHVCSDFYLPLSMRTLTCKEYTIQQKKYQQEEAKSLANKHLEIYLEKLKEKDIQIMEKNVMIELDENKCRANGTIKVKEPIGSYAPTEVLTVPVDEGIHTQ